MRALEITISILKLLILLPLWIMIESLSLLQTLAKVTRRSILSSIRKLRNYLQSKRRIDVSKMHHDEDFRLPTMPGDFDGDPVELKLMGEDYTIDENHFKDKK